MPSKDEKKEPNRWGFEKRVGPATIINFTQLVTIVWLGSAFYTQVNADRARTDERFQSFAESRKTQDVQIEKMQSSQQEIVVKMTHMGDEQEATTETLKDIRELLRKGK